jgi:hypothetical protein
MHDIERSQPWEAISEPALVSAMRRAQPEAVDEFIRRFGGMVLHYACRLGVPPGARKRWAADVLFEVAVTIAARQHRVSPGLAAHILARCMLKRPPNEMLNKGTVVDAGDGLRAIQHARLEAIVDPNTRRIVTIRPRR